MSDFDAERKTCYYCDKRGHDSGGLCTECNKSWFGPHRKTILGKCECNGRTYDLTATGYILCIECSAQYCKYDNVRRVLNEL